jgi:hypothetical protein
MKNLFCKFLCMIHSFTRIKAATVLARHGNHEAANRIMSEKDQCKC